MVLPILSQAQSRLNQVSKVKMQPLNMGLSQPSELLSFLDILLMSLSKTKKMTHQSWYTTLIFTNENL